ncbi:hypothetical protein [Bacillus cereus group sp. Bce006]|uniref:hypothetical protein n=1 Tax=Bacillus cereus group sp. Bce006 TaxID=3445255 RepID=UPI003F26DC66
MKIKSTVIAGALFVGASFSNAGSLQSQFGIKSTMFKPLQAQAPCKHQLKRLSHSSK